MKNRMLLLAILSLCLICSGPAICSVQVTANSADPALYDFVLTGCTLEEVLQEIYTRFDVSTFAVLTGSESIPASKKLTRIKPEDIVPWLVNDRSTTTIGKSCVLYPHPHKALISAVKVLESRLVASLTPEQLDTNATEGGVPFKSLNEDQQNIVRQLALIHSSYPNGFFEPELTRRIEQSRVILALHPRVAAKYLIPGRSGDSGDPTREVRIDCDQRADLQLTTPWRTGSAEAFKLCSTVLTEPGSDAPGTGDKTKLSGVYSLGALVRIVQDGCSLPIKLDPGYDSVRVVAYGEVTKATLARVIAITSGGEWAKNETEWRLTLGALTKTYASYDPNKPQAYFEQLNVYRPAVQAALRSGKVRLVADPEWNDIGLVKTMGVRGPVDLGSLNDRQRQYLKDAYDSYRKTSGETGAPAEMSEAAKIEWDSIYRLYIATDNTLLSKGEITGN